MMAGRPKSIVTQAMVTSAKKRLKGAKKGCTVSVSEGTWLHFGSVGITLHKVGELISRERSTSTGGRKKQ